MQYRPFFLVGTLLFALSAAHVSHAQSDDSPGSIEARQETMQALWQRVDRLSAFVTRSASVASGTGDAVVLERQGMDPREVYALVHGTEALQDARDIVDLLGYVRTLWPNRSNRSWFGETNAEPVAWVLPDVFQRYFDHSAASAEELADALSGDSTEDAQRAVCNLSLTCGRCHAVFRRVVHRELKLEGNGWTGNYAVCRDLMR